MRSGIAGIVLLTILTVSALPMALAQSERGVGQVIEPEAPDSASEVMDSREEETVRELPGGLPQVPDSEKVLTPGSADEAHTQRLLSNTEAVHVGKIVLQGSTVLSDETEAMISQYENRDITIVDLHELRYRLSRIYYDAGYVNSGVIIPDQEVTDGSIRLDVIEGQLTDTTVSGNRYLRAGYIKDRLSLGVSDPLNRAVLEDALTLLRQEPLIRRVKATLSPGAERGESYLAVDVKEDSPYQFFTGVDNHRSPSIGAERGSLSATHRSLTRRGDTLAARAGLGTDGEDFATSYEFPVTRRNTRLRLGFSRSDSAVVEEPFVQIDVENQSEAWEFELEHPFLRQLSDKITDSSNSLAGSFSLDRTRTESSLLGIPFSFSPGVQAGVSKTTVLGVGADWTRSSRNQVLVLGNTIRVGIDAFDATINRADNRTGTALVESRPDGKFFAWQGQFQYGRRFHFLGSQAVLRSVAQISADPLLPSEKFAVGGVNTVRGYRENQLVRDNGVAASIEARLPPFQNTRNRYLRSLQLTIFADYGRSWDKDNAGAASNASDTSEAQAISSVGLGLLWTPWRSLRTELFWGQALDNVESGQEHDIQDDGVHFLLSYQVY